MQPRNPNLQCVDAAHQLIIDLVLAVDSRSAAFFRPDLRPAEQMRRRTRQLGEVVIHAPGPVRLVYRAGHKLVEVVDPRHLHIPVAAEEVGGLVRHREHRLFVADVDQVLYVVRLGPVGLLAEERAAEDAAPHVGVIRGSTHRLLRRLAVEPVGHIRRHIVALLRLELLLQRGAPGSVLVFRLIAEEPQNGLAELVAHRAVVGVVRDVQEGVGGLGVQIVDQRIQPILGPRPVRAIEVACVRTEVDVPQDRHLPVVARLIRRCALSRRDPLQLPVRGHRDRDHLLDRPALLCLRRPDRNRARGNRQLQRLARVNADRDVCQQGLHPKLGIALADGAAGKPARIVALVLEPQPHVALRGLRDDEFHLVHVSRRKVCRFARRAPSRRQVHDEEAVGRQPVEVAHNVRPHHCRVRAIPTRKR